MVYCWAVKLALKLVDLLVKNLVENSAVLMVCYWAAQLEEKMVALMVLKKAVSLGEILAVVLVWKMADHWAKHLAGLMDEKLVE